MFIPMEARKADSFWWDGDDLLVKYADGARETIRYANAHFSSGSTPYPPGDGVEVVDPKLEKSNAP